MADLTNNLNPLDWRVPITNPNGTPTPEFQRKWAEQMRTNGSIPDLTSAAAVSEVLDLFSTARGSLLARGASAWGALAIGGANTVLKSNGTDPVWDTMTHLLDTLGATQGNVLYRNATNWTALAPGTAGQVLTTGGAAANPSWATPSGGGGGAASAQDNGTTLYLAASDANGQLVLDGSGSPVFVPEVLPTSAIPIDTKVLGVVAGLISTKFCGMAVVLTANQAGSGASFTPIKFDGVTIDTLGAYSAATGLFTPTKAGKWAFFAAGQGQVGTSLTSFQIRIRKNGVDQAVGIIGQNPGSPTLSFIPVAFALVAMNGTTDSLRVDGLIVGTGGSEQFTSGASQCVLIGMYLGA